MAELTCHGIFGTIIELHSIAWNDAFDLVSPVVALDHKLRRLGDAVFPRGGAFSCD
ncbi:hypothetical protein PSCLAVI8L_190007 [Pseudoclavibacter sp. 8L]|nr:hypothetical protein PSCLAVI8L_190007 [Pseudoclavibacter sp. 8L]